MTLRQFLEPIIFVLIAIEIAQLGISYGRQRLQLDIIEACIDRNPEMSYSAARVYCRNQYNKLGVK